MYNNMRATENLRKKSSHNIEIIGGSKTKYHIAKGVDASLIILIFKRISQNAAKKQIP